MKKFFWLAAFFMMGVSSAFGATTEGKEGLLPLGSPMPAFRLIDVVSGQSISSDDFKDKKVLMVAFICRHCPYVQHVKKALSQMGQDYVGKDVAIVAISSNDPAGYADDAPDKLKEMAQEEGFVFPFLFDETQEIAKSFTAMATPDIFIFDKERKLVYRGQFDETRPNSDSTATGQDTRQAIEAILSGEPIGAQKPAIGCSIKWKPGNAPAYAQ